MCKCEKTVRIGSYDNTVRLEHDTLGKAIFVDRCIADEIKHLLDMGIVTLASCCGHNRTIPVIMVAPQYIGQMKQLGYKPQRNNFLIGTECEGVCFYPKTVSCSVWIKLKTTMSMYYKMLLEWIR